MRLRLFAAACALALAGCSSGTEPGGQDNPNGGASFEERLAYAGTFHPVVHDGQGMAQVYVLESGRELRFTDDFATTSGPRLEVWLVEADDPQDSETVLQSQYVSLGALKSASGAQSYAVPANVDLGRYRSVTVWCVPFSVNFTTAPLMMQ